MAVKFVKKTRLLTGNNFIGAGQSELTISFFYRPDGNTSQTGGSFLFNRNYYSGPFAIMQNTTNGKSRVTFALPMLTGTVRPTAVYDFPLGSTSHVAIVHKQGSQLLYVNGNPIPMGTVTGQTWTSGQPAPWVLGGADGNPPDDVARTLGNFAVWNGYAATREEIRDLRDLKKTPMDIGASATQRWWWTLSGKDGTTPTLSQGGLINQFGGGYNFAASDGAGSIKYVPDLDWAPSVKIDRAYISTCGTLVGMWFKGVNGIDAIPSTLNTMPRISRNGVDLGELRDPWICGYTKWITFALPGNEAVTDTDTAEITVPAGWLTTDIGLVEGAQNRPLENRYKKSIIGTETKQKTLRFGVNLSPNATSVGNATYAANLLYKSDPYINSQTDSTGHPTHLPWPIRNIAALMFTHFENDLDGTGYPGPLGLHLLRWVDLDPSQGLDHDFSEQSGYRTYDENMTIVERMDLRNYGRLVDGKIVNAKVLDIQAVPGAPSAKRLVRLRTNCNNPAPKYEKFQILGPDDFTFTDGVPVTYELTDPYAVTNTMKRRLQGIGSLRWPDAVAENAGSTQMSEPEHLFNITDERWGFGRASFKKNLGIRQARPYSPENCPFVYHNWTGSRYPVSLAAPIVSADQTEIKINYSKQNPVFANLRLFAGNETMRIVDVVGIMDDGNVVTAIVTRGGNLTNPVERWDGDIECGYRMAMADAATLSLVNGFILEIVTDGPHGIWSGLSQDWNGPWPTFEYDDGMKLNNKEWSGFAWVTGPDRFLCASWAPNAKVTNLSKTYDLDPTQCYSRLAIPKDGSFTPYEAAAHMTGQFPDCDLVLEFGFCASDDLIIEIYRRVRDRYPAGRRLVVEPANEPWNWGFPQNRYFRTLTSLKRGTGDFVPTYMDRAFRLREIGVKVFNEGGRNRGDEIHLMINVNARPGGSLTSMLDYAANQSPPEPVDMVGVAPYVECPEDASDKITTAIQEKYTVEQCIDLYIHMLLSNVGPQSYPKSFEDTNARIKAYTDKTGFPCSLMGYEGDVGCPISHSVSNFQAKVMDMLTHPNWYFAQHAYCAMIQDAGFTMFNIYRYSDIFYRENFWPIYTWMYQEPCRGDGSDGKINNLLCRAMPGQPNSKAPTDSHMQKTGSVRGKALIDWNREAEEYWNRVRVAALGLGDLL